MYDRHSLNVIQSGMEFIKANGGVEKLANHYNALDEQGKEHFRGIVMKAFGKEDACESLVLLLDKVAKIKGYGTLGLLMCDLKDGIVRSSVDSSRRTMKNWRWFLRHEKECGNDIMLGILDELEDETFQSSEKCQSANNATPKATPSSTTPDFPLDLINSLYAYNDIVFKHISSLTEFQHIIYRIPHNEKLVECSGRKTHLYQILWRLHKLPPTKDHETWLEDICLECGFNTTTISKKYCDSNNMKEDNRKLLEELSRLFDQQETKRN